MAPGDPSFDPSHFLKKEEGKVKETIDKFKEKKQLAYDLWIAARSRRSEWSSSVPPSFDEWQWGKEFRDILNEEEQKEWDRLYKERQTLIKGISNYNQKKVKSDKERKEKVDEATKCLDEVTPLVLESDKADAIKENADKVAKAVKELDLVCVEEEGPDLQDVAEKADNLIKQIDKKAKELGVDQPAEGWQAAKDSVWGILH